MLYGLNFHSNDKFNVFNVLLLKLFTNNTAYCITKSINIGIGISIKLVTDLPSTLFLIKVFIHM